MNDVLGVLVWCESSFVCLFVSHSLTLLAFVCVCVCVRCVVVCVQQCMRGFFCCIFSLRSVVGFLMVSVFVSLACYCLDTQNCCFFFFFFSFCLVEGFRSADIMPIISPGIFCVVYQFPSWKYLCSVGRTVTLFTPYRLKLTKVLCVMWMCGVFFSLALGCP